NRALATKPRQMYEDARRQVDADIRTQSATLASGRARLAVLGRALLPAADERVRLADDAYSAGAGTLDDDLEERRARLDERLQVLDLER
ncbi:TolC family protein, partial [Burkholderia pseudomallei]